MKTKEDIIVRSKRDLYEHFDVRIKRIEDKMEEMCAIEDKPNSVKEIMKELLASKERLERTLARLDIEEEEEAVMLKLAYFSRTVQQAELFVVEVGSLCVKEPDVGLRWGVATREKGSLARKAFLLNKRYDWEIGRDEEDVLCLVPIKKEV